MPTKLPQSFSCIQIITPRSSPIPSDGPYPAFISTSEFDPVLYREELIRKAYLTKFPLYTERPDYLITVGRGHKTCSTISVEVKGQEDKSGRSRMPAAFAGITCTIVFLFILMLYFYMSGFVQF
ncbi:UMA domain-containing protein [Caenorhabditis elegans]|uniref:UMA domain-containing protein n=1 Tax=Caenorhabditis elegans TaxID=6239 RepID=O02149_CAEEL|nr:UMA domain-containing protein [Caenorhabditis elegans]CCD68409.1 UMA domain-containing protein [Caenorhabditis elegans]|eukprot:NP_508763.2 Uncharacterized protein CELE_F15A8.1 [Caenorhabditis elegans]